MKIPEISMPSVKHLFWRFYRYTGRYAQLAGYTYAGQGHRVEFKHWCFGILFLTRSESTNKEEGNE